MITFNQSNLIERSEFIYNFYIGIPAEKQNFLGFYYPINFRLFRNGSVLVRINLIPYKYLTIILTIITCFYSGYVIDSYPYICTIVKNTYDSNSLEFQKKYLMFKVVMCMRVISVLVGAGRMPGSCAATVLYPKTVSKKLCSSFLDLLNCIK